MGRTPRDVTEKELEVLRILWEHGPLPIGRITAVLYSDRRSSYYATVQKLLERLEAKGFVRHERPDGVLSFTAALDREQFISRRLLDMADKLCGGSLTPLLMNLVRAKPLSVQELEELRALVEELRPHAKPRGKQR